MKGDDRVNNSVTTLIIMGAVMFAVIGILTVVSNIYSIQDDTGLTCAGQFRS